jgi:hypothetical protein
VIKENTLFNPSTNCFTCVYHGNGGNQDKQYFIDLYDQIRYNLNSYNYNVIKKE